MHTELSLNLGVEELVDACILDEGLLEELIVECRNCCIHFFRDSQTSDLGCEIVELFV